MQALQRFVTSVRNFKLGAVAGPIGLDIAARSVHMLQFEGSGDPPMVRAAISLPYVGDRDALLKDKRQFKALIDRALSSRPFKGRRVISSMAQGDVRMLTLNYQQPPGVSEPEAILKELRERFKNEVDESVVDYVKIRSGDTETTEKSAIVALARRDRVLAYLDALQSAGLEPEALDIGPAALTRLVASMGKSSQYANALLINFGRDKSYMSVIWGRRLMLDREVDFGESRLIARVGKTLNLPEEMATDLLYRHGFQGAAAAVGSAAPSDTSAEIAEIAEIRRTATQVLRPEFAALAAEVSKTLIYTASKTRGQSVERVYLLGSIARYPGVAPLLEAMISTAVEVLNPFGAFGARLDATVLQELDPIAGIGLATGLAL